jgi:hemoglobin-like flavoprotein
MNSEQIILVKTSFAEIAPLAEEAAVLFYAKLFDLDPDLRRLFKSGIREQGLKLMQMLELAVNGLDRIEELVPVVRALGVRHAGYGVEDCHYETVGKALLWMLEKALRTDFTPETKEAWTIVYDLLAQTMKDGARHRIEGYEVSHHSRSGSVGRQL